MDMDDEVGLEALKGKTITRAELLTTTGDPVDPSDPDGPAVQREELVLFFDDGTQLQVVSAELGPDGDAVDAVSVAEAPPSWSGQLHSTALLFDLDEIDEELVKMLDEAEDEPSR